MAYDLLEGVKVVELAMYAFAPSSTAVLADWGAAVVKVVAPDRPDVLMGNAIGGLPDRDVGVRFMWEILNRGKRSIGIDIGVDEGRDLLLELLADADVFVTNLLPARRRKYRLEPDDVFAVNPGLVYARASGHGNDGPEREAGGYDHTDYWARTGIGHAASMVADEFAPQVGPAFGDLASGTFLAGAIAAALVRKERSGRGAVIDVSLFSSGMWMASPGIVASQLYDVDNIPRFRHHQLTNPTVAAYATSDDRYVYLAGIQTEGHFEQFCELVGRPDLVADPRFADGRARAANAAACIAELDGVFAGRTLAEWLPILRQMTTPWSIVQTAAEAANDPQALANGYLTEIEGTSGPFPVVMSPARVDESSTTLTRAPDHGEHTDEILLGTGRDWDQILELKAKGAVL
ncbi:MAG: CoA transferase [Acidimicrobiales bacterium]|nr:CoA transferase [Acidimicrobiales bacterium]